MRCTLLMKRLSRLAVATMMLLAGLASTAPALAAERFVSTTGSDSTGNGSRAAPYRTLSRVLSPSAGIVRAGDVVTLLATASNPVFNECDVRLRVPLTIRSDAARRAHIHCDIQTPDSVTIQIDPDASGSRLSNLEISGGRYYGIFLQTDWDVQGNPGGRGASNIVIEDVYVHDTGRDAIKITPKSDYVTIRRAEIARSGAGYAPGTPLDDKNAEGIDNVNGSFMIVEDSYIHDTATTGVYFKGGATDVIVQRNRIENVGIAGVLVGFDTSPEYFDTVRNPQYYEAIRGIVRNNVIRNANYAGIGLYAAQDSVVANNTVINTGNLGHAALYFGVTFQDYEPAAGRPANRGVVLRNNLVQQQGGDCIRIRYSDELGGLSGLAGAVDSDFNVFHAASGACVFADARPGSTLAGSGLAAWRTAMQADGASTEVAVALDSTGRPLSGGATEGRGAPLPAVVDDLQRVVRVSPPDIGAHQVTAAAGVRVMSEFRHGELDYYFITARDDEKLLLDSVNGWQRTGAEFKVHASVQTGLHGIARYYFDQVARGGQRGSHFYTAIAAEKDALAALNPGNARAPRVPFAEGEDGYVPLPTVNGSVASCGAGYWPIYRAFRGPARFADDANHRFTTDARLHERLVAAGWDGEGVKLCALR